MELGLFSLMNMRDHPNGYAGVYADTRKMVQTAEDVGFDIAWFAEHHFSSYCASCSPLMMAAYAAGWTKRIKLGTAVIILPLYHPLRVAQELIMLDHQSEGRAVIGVGTGYQKFEFDRFGVNIQDKNEIFLEYWDIVEDALTKSLVEHSGKHITVPRTTFEIKPRQRPRPPLYVTCSHPDILVRFKDTDAVPFLGAGPHGSPALYKMVDELNQNWFSVGYDPAKKPLAIMQYIHVTDSRAQALEAADRGRYLGRMAHHLRTRDLPANSVALGDEPVEGEQPLEKYVENMLIGDPHHVAERIVTDIRRVGPTHYVFHFQFGCMPLDRAHRSLERFARDVIPLIERELGPIAKINRLNDNVPRAAVGGKA